MKTTKQLIIAIVIGLVLAAGVSYGYSTWTFPTADPTGNNPDAPINTGSSNQAKLGGLAIGYSDASIVPSSGLVTKGLLYSTGIASFNESVGFAKTVNFSGNPALKIWQNPGEGKVLTSDSSGNANWKNLKSTIVLSEDNKQGCSQGKSCSNTWNNTPALCDIGWVRTGCTVSCAGSFTNSSDDLFPMTSGNQEGCNLGDNDVCESSGGPQYPGRIRVRAICVKFQ